MATAPGSLTTSAGDPTAVIGNVLKLLGGEKGTTVTNPGDTGPLRGTLGQLQGANYEQMLQSIFQQAGGQIPGLQVALGNARGARSGGNSAVQTALMQLLKDTTIAGQSQMAKQQLDNQQLQVQAGNSIAQATKGTNTTQKSGVNVGKAAGMLGLLQAVSKLAGDPTVGKLIGSMTGGAMGTSAAAPNNIPMNSPKPAAPVTSTGAYNPTQTTPGVASNGMGGGIQMPTIAMPTVSTDVSQGRDLSPDFANFSDMFANEANMQAAATGGDTLDALMEITNAFGTGGGDLDFTSNWQGVNNDVNFDF